MFTWFFSKISYLAKWLVRKSHCSMHVTLIWVYVFLSILSRFRKLSWMFSEKIVYNLWMFDFYRFGTDFLPNVRQAFWHYSKPLSLHLKRLKISLDIANAILERSSVLVVIRSAMNTRYLLLEFHVFVRIGNERFRTNVQIYCSDLSVWLPCRTLLGLFIETRVRGLCRNADW